MREPPFTWKCPYCEMQQAVTVNNYNKCTNQLDVASITGNGEDYLLGTYEKIKCANPKCNKITIYSSIFIDEFRMVPNSLSSSTKKLVDTKQLFNKRLLPQSDARIIPDFIPKAIAEDYLEACLIKDASPKASATLIRRCLQGMIRDFCGISESTLYKEISELKNQVEENTAPREISIESVEAIDAIRKIGNIGAHMEKDVNEIIDVEANEAQCLIELVETLFDDWYISRENRKNRFNKALEISNEKDTLKQLKKSTD